MLGPAFLAQLRPAVPASEEPRVQLPEHVGHVESLGAGEVLAASTLLAHLVQYPCVVGK